MEQQLADHDRRLSALEKAQQEMKSDMRVARVQQEHIDKRFDKLDANMSKLGWLVAAGLVGGVMSFILGGGLTVVS